MTRLTLAIIRILALFLSYFLSTFAAALFVTFTLFLGSDLGWLQDDPFVTLGSLGFVTTIWISLVNGTFFPFAGITVIAEFARLSSLIFNLLLGGFLAFVYLILYWTPQQNESGYGDQEIWIAALAAGFVGGFVHWLIAGYRAGRWLGPPKAIN